MKLSAHLSLVEMVLGGLTIAIIAATATYILTKLRGARLFRIERIENRKSFEATKTETPLDHPQRQLRKRSIKSVEELFRRQRWIVLAFFMVISFFVIVPLAAQSVPAAYTPLLLGAFTVVLGITARPFIENVISGIIISMSQAVRIGDTVSIDGHYGTVEYINLTNTVVRIWDWRRYVLPNSRMMNKEFVNYSLVDGFIWAHAEIFLSPDADLERAEQIALESVAASKYFRPHETPQFWVMEITPQAIRCWAAGWADTPSDAWMLGHDVRRRLHIRYREEGIQYSLIHVKPTGPSQLTDPEPTPQPAN